MFDMSKGSVVGGELKRYSVGVALVQRNYSVVVGVESIVSSSD